MKKRDLYYERIPTKLLREDVRYLGNILGKVIKEQEGQKFFELVEKVRKLSKANKTSPNINQTNSELALELIAIDYMKNKDDYEINLIFNNNSHIALTAETIEVRLEDQNEITE